MLSKGSQHLEQRSTQTRINTTSAMVQPVEHIVYAIHDYEIPGKGFLALKAGDVIYVVEADASGWWLGVNLRRQKGVFPSTYTLPYVFPLPPTDLRRDARLLLLAREYHVDLTSGSPAPLSTLEASPSFAVPPPSPPLSSAILREELQRLLLDRETARRTVMECFTQLLDTREKQLALLQRASEAKKAREQKRDVRLQKVKHVREEVQNVLERLERRKERLLKEGKAPPAAWYHMFAEVAASSALVDARSNTATTREGVWRSALRELKTLVRQQEEQLAALSSSCATKETEFTEAAGALQKRIEWRDSHVKAMLTYWADAATHTKSKYISCKAERDSAAAAQQQEAAQLRRRLEEGRERFTETRESYRKLKREAQKISALLAQREVLDALSSEIAEVDREIAALQQRI
jgi:hypothetical protein